MTWLYAQVTNFPFQPMHFFYFLLYFSFLFVFRLIYFFIVFSYLSDSVFWATQAKFFPLFWLQLILRLLWLMQDKFSPMWADELFWATTLREITVLLLWMCAVPSTADAEAKPKLPVAVAGGGQPLCAPPTPPPPFPG